MKKKFLIAAICAALSAGALTGCSGKESTNPSVVVGEVTQTPKNYYDGDEFETVLWNGEVITSLPDSLVFHKEVEDSSTKEIFERYYRCPDFESEGIPEGEVQYGVRQKPDGSITGFIAKSYAADTDGYAFDMDACNHLTSKTGLKLGMDKTEVLEIMGKYEGYDNITVNTNDLGGFSITYRHISDGKNDYSIMIEVNFAHASDGKDTKVVKLSVIRTDFDK